MKKFIRILLRENLIKEETITKVEFFKQNNIDPEELSYMGNGDFGEAYAIGDGRVLKITRSKSEFNFAKGLVGKDLPALAGFVNFYVADVVDDNYYIIMEELDEDSDIENMYYQVEELLSNEGLPIQYLHMLDIDELELDEDMLKFISDIEDINHSYRYLGIEASDIKPDNLGVDKNGKIKAFDIDDRSVNELYKL
jgi:serine/threonine protein kinase